MQDAALNLRQQLVAQLEENRREEAVLRGLREERESLLREVDAFADDWARLSALLQADLRQIAAQR